MTTAYRIFGAELSPYSVKVRSYFRYKGIPHRVDRAQRGDRGGVPEVREAADRAARGDARRQGASRTRRRSSSASRRSIPEPSIHPPSPVARVRLGAARGVRRRVGQQVDVPLPLGARGRSDRSAGARSRAAMMPGADDEQHAAHDRADRASAWSAACGSSARATQTAPQIEDSFQRRARAARRAPRRRGRTCSARGRVRRLRAVGAALRVPGPIRPPGALIEGRAPHVLAWVAPHARGRAPRARSRPGRALRADARCRCCERQVGALFLPWSARQRRGDRGGPGGVQRRARRPRLDAEAAEVPRASRWRRCATKYAAVARQGRRSTRVLDARRLPGGAAAHDRSLHRADAERLQGLDHARGARAPLRGARDQPARRASRRSPSTWRINPNGRIPAIVDRDEGELRGASSRARS